MRPNRKIVTQNYEMFIVIKVHISCFDERKEKSILQLITGLDDVIQEDLNDAGEAPVFVLITSSTRGVTTSQVSLVATNLLILQGCREHSPDNINST